MHVPFSVYRVERGRDERAPHRNVGGGLSLLASSFREATSAQLEGLSIGDWATWVGDGLALISILGGCLVGLIALAGVGVAWRQSLQTRAIHIAESRPYVVPSIGDGENRDGKDSLYLKLENHGKTPAMRIHVEFLTDERWHNVSQPESFPFHILNAGIPLLAPHSYLEFFIGEKKKDAQFVKVLEDGVDVRVTFYGLIQVTPHSDTFAVTARNKFARRADSK